MSIKRIGKQIERRIHQISRILMYVGVVVLFAMMLIQTFDVFGRYLFGKSVITLGLRLKQLFIIPSLAGFKTMSF